MNIYDDEDEYDHEATGWFCTCPSCMSDEINDKSNSEDGAYYVSERGLEDELYYDSYEYYGKTYVIKNIEIIRETEKAYLIRFSIKDKPVSLIEFDWDDEADETVDEWFPKSQVIDIKDGKMNITEYIYNKKFANKKNQNNHEENTNNKNNENKTTQPSNLIKIFKENKHKNAINQLELSMHNNSIISITSEVLINFFDNLGFYPCIISVGTSFKYSIMDIKSSEKYINRNEASVAMFERLFELLELRTNKEENK